MSIAPALSIVLASAPRSYPAQGELAVSVFGGLGHSMHTPSGILYKQGKHQRRTLMKTLQGR